MNVREPGFGVWRIWDELKCRGRAVTFDDGPGLGVWEKQPAHGSPLRDRLFGANPAALAVLSDYYRARVSELQKLIATDGEPARSGKVRWRMRPWSKSSIVRTDLSGSGSVVARIGHETWKDMVIPLPAQAGAAPLRIDFLSALHVIEVAHIRVRRSAEVCFDASRPAAFDKIDVRGDAQRLPDPSSLRIKIIGIIRNFTCRPSRAGPITRRSLSKCGCAFVRAISPEIR